MKRILMILLGGLLLPATAAGQQGLTDYPEHRLIPERSELTFVGYYLIRSELSDIAPTNEFLKGQVVGRLFGGNTTFTSSKTSQFTEQRFLPMFTYTPRLFDGWAKMRASFELDWTWGDANYGAGGNFGGAFAADAVNLQTQNVFIEFHPRQSVYINAGLLRTYDNVRVPWYTFVDDLLLTGYRLAMFGSDASGAQIFKALAPDLRLKLGGYEFYENNVEQADDVSMYDADLEKDLGIATSVGVSVNYLRDKANSEGGVSILGQGLNSALSNYNGVFNFNFAAGEKYKADIFWLGTHFHHNPLLMQGRFGLSGFAWYNLGQAKTVLRTVDIGGLAGNLRLAWRYGRCQEDQIVLDGIFTTGDDNNISDNKYSGVLTGNNWTSPGAVFISHGLYLLLPQGTVVNRYVAAVEDIQNIGYGLTAGSLTVARDLVQNKFRVKLGTGIGMATKTPAGMKKFIGSEVNLNLRYRPKVFLDLELHAAYLWLGDFFESPVVNGSPPGEPSYERPKDPWTMFASVKWIMF
jgi:hypothetical protein